MPGATLRVDRHISLAAITSLGLGFGLLLVAWVMATQPFAAPDEPSHYLRALSIANGHLLGPTVPYPYGGLMPAQLAWVDQGTRAVWVPAGQSPPVPCIDHKPDFAVLAPGCLEASEVGNYHPLPYLLPALALDMSNDSTTGLYLSRLASAIPCLAFILLAFALLWDGSAWSLLGPLAAITPMVLFVSSIVNPNGLELAACLAFAACVLRIARAPTHLPSRVWAAFALSGAVTILAWQLGPIFVIADLALGASLLGPAGLRTLRLSAGRRLRPPPLTLITATALYMVYGLASGVTHSTFSISPVAQGLHEGLSQLVPVLGNSVGTFGALTVSLPFAAYWTWWLFVAAIILGAMWVGGRRDRSLLIAVVALALAFPVLFFAWVYRFTGFGMQGRYVLPVMVLIPLLAGEMIHRRLQTRPSHRLRELLPVGAAVLAAGFQAYAWWFNASVVAGAPNTISFYAHARWSPPLGWWPWIASAAVGTAALLAFAMLGTLASRAPLATSSRSGQ